jgi:hypothetical protein
MAPGVLALLGAHESQGEAHRQAMARWGTFRHRRESLGLLDELEAVAKDAGGEAMTPIDREALKKLAEAATQCSVAVGIYEAHDALEKIKGNLDFGTGPVWLVWVVDHPKTVIGENPLRPEHVAIAAITGNGPTSQANANYYAAANPAAIMELLAELEKAEAERDHWRLEEQAAQVKMDTLEADLAACQHDYSAEKIWRETAEGQRDEARTLVTDLSTILRRMVESCDDRGPDEAPLAEAREALKKVTP